MDDDRAADRDEVSVQQAHDLFPRIQAGRLADRRWRHDQRGSLSRTVP
jgi:hypothetical protein